MTSSSRPSLLWLLVIVVIGAGSGVAAASLAVYSFTDYAARLQDLSVPLRLSEIRPATTQDSVDVARVLEDVAPTSVAFFSEGRVADRPESALTQGVVLTSDGWILVAGGVDLTRARARVGRRSYLVERVVRDGATNTSFVKIDAESLPVVSFGSSRGVEIGDEFVRMDGPDRAGASSFVGVDYGDVVDRASDVPTRVLVMDAGASGSSLFDASGKLVALMVSATRAVPVESMLPALSSLLRSDVIARPSLGVTTIDLFHTVPTVGTLRPSGARVTSARPLSAAALAHVRVGDVILEVGGEPVGRRSLEELMVELTPGSSVSLLVEHADGTRTTVPVNIGAK